MKAAIIGANGTLGNALYHELLSAGIQCTGLTTKDRPPLVRVDYTVSSLRPFIGAADIVLYCIGISKFAECEALPEKSLYLNTELPTKIAQSLSSDQTFVYLSSPIALVNFKGKKPWNYAIHKHSAEENILQAARDNALIIRPSKIIESTTVLKEWKQTLKQDQYITPFFDQFISPISAGILASQTWRLIQRGHTGCYNFSAADRISYMDMARQLAEQLGLDTALINKKSAEEHNPYFFRQDILDCSEAQKATGFSPPKSKDIIFDYVQKLA